MSSLTLKQVTSFVGGALLTGLSYGFLVFLFVMGTFSFVGEELPEKENREAFEFFATVAILLITLYIVFRQYRSGKRFTAAGVATAGIIALYGVVYTGRVYISNLRYYEAFDKNIWLKNESKPFNMAKTLVKKWTLTGLSKQEVLEKLGPAKRPCQDECSFLVYDTNNWNWDLYILFENNKVKEVYLYQEGLFAD